MKKSGIVLASFAAGSLSLAGATLLSPIHQACAQHSRVSFAEDIAPIFKGWCVSCHQPGGDGYNASGLDLTSYDGVMKGTKFGPMVIPSHPDESNLLVLVEGRAKVRMPFGHKALPNCLRNNIWTWIFQGAKNN
ncbi:MAG: c-type cytochrome domain-containing protein [Xanthobacteraceae bacterium]